MRLARLLSDPRSLWGYVLVAALGCGGSPPAPADRDQALGALRTTLDTWQCGSDAILLQAQKPPIQVVDHEWRSGYKLLRYQVEKDAAFGGDLRCQVKLSLKDARGRPVSKTAVYSVGTGSPLTVVREEDP